MTIIICVLLGRELGFFPTLAGASTLFSFIVLQVCDYRYLIPISSLFHPYSIPISSLFNPYSTPYSTPYSIPIQPLFNPYSTPI